VQNLTVEAIFQLPALVRRSLQLQPVSFAQFAPSWIAWAHQSFEQSWLCAASLE
jgi:hypothetical protein